jgi:hypothetical protein
LYAMLISPMHATCPSHPPWFSHPNNIWWSIYVMKLFIMQSSPASSHFLPLRSKYFLQHTVLKHSHYVLPLVWETKFHTHTFGCRERKQILINFVTGTS